MITKTACLMALLLTSFSALAGDMLTLDFAQKSPSKAKVYGTRTQSHTASISTRAGERVIMSQQSGSDYQLQGSGYGWAWTQVQEIPRDMTSLAVTPTVNDGQVTIEVEYSSKDGSDVQIYNGTVSGNLGQWIVLLGGSESAGSSVSAGGKSWTAGSASRGLSVRVRLNGQASP